MQNLEALLNVFFFHLLEGFRKIQEGPLEIFIIFLVFDFLYFPRFWDTLINLKIKTSNYWKHSKGCTTIFYSAKLFLKFRYPPERELFKTIFETSKRFRKFPVVPSSFLQLYIKLWKFYNKFFDSSEIL